MIQPGSARHQRFYLRFLRGKPVTGIKKHASHTGYLYLHIKSENYLYPKFLKVIRDLMKKKIAAVIAIALWLMIISTFMLLASRIDLEIFFVLWLIGLLVIVELMDTKFSLPQYMRYLKYVVAVGIIIFGGIVTTKIMEILSS
jgi:hypothetical protein